MIRDFPTSTIPIRFIGGDWDHSTPAELAREYFELVEAPEKTFTVIEGAVHMVMWDAPNSWAQTVVDFANQTRTD